MGLVGTTGLAAAIIAAIASSPSMACYIVPGSKPLTDERYDEINRANSAKLTELFEAKIIKDKSSEGWRLQVGRVFAGSLKYGDVIRGYPKGDTCNPELPKSGDEGLIWVGWGPDGPSFHSDFVKEAGVRSLKRIGLLPGDYIMPSIRKFLPPELPRIR
ncbi:hypothetical protein JW805_17505 [Roseomonas aeriglobus]|nr:hypothetical protein [Roseomonas aeriglobus]